MEPNIEVEEMGIQTLDIKGRFQEAYMKKLSRHSHHFVTYKLKRERKLTFPAYAGSPRFRFVWAPATSGAHPIIDSDGLFKTITETVLAVVFSSADELQVEQMGTITLQENFSSWRGVEGAVCIQWWHRFVPFWW